jgi:DNA invertase Pin-like site-specific DNA recombinase
MGDNLASFFRTTSRKLYFILKKGGKCERCGLELEKEPYLADFHHKDEKLKEYHPTDILSNSLSKAEKELDKCELVCAICHRRIHYNIERLNKYRELIYEKINDESFFTEKRDLINDKEIVDGVIELNNKGLFVKTIAKELGINRTSVMTILERNGLEPNKFDRSNDNKKGIDEREFREAAKQGLNAKQMAEKFDCSKATIFNYLNEYDVKLVGSLQKNKKNLDKFKSLLDDGKSVKEICDYFGFSDTTFRRWKSSV